MRVSYCVLTPKMRKLKHMSQQLVGSIPEWSLADRMRKAREITGLDQSAFGEELGVSRATVSNAERGRTSPSRLLMRAWALRSGVPLQWLETGKDPRPDGGPNGGLTDQRTRRDSNPQPSDQEWNGDLVPGPWNLEAVAA